MSTNPSHVGLLVALAVLGQYLTPVRATAANRLEQVDSWGFQLQRPNPEILAHTGCDLLIIDYSRDGSGDATLSRRDLDRMRTTGRERAPVLLSYLSIGEAEDYRFYWKREWTRNPPDWLGNENPQWPGNYTVAYWHPAWKGLIYGSPGSYLDRIIGAGFDGVYLDRVDAFYNWEHRLGDAQQAMIQFVAELRAYARARNPNFLIVGQNAEVLLQSRRYRGLIDGFAKEDLFYGVSGSGRPNPPAETSASLQHIRRALDAGIPAFLVEYNLDQREVAQVLKKAGALGILPTFASRSLSKPPQCS
jgi:cysteinyl-tRNA synthetase